MNNLLKNKTVSENIRKFCKLVRNEDEILFLLNSLSDYDVNLVLNSFNLLAVKHEERNAKLLNIGYLCRNMVPVYPPMLK